MLVIADSHVVLNLPLHHLFCWLAAPQKAREFSSTNVTEHVFNAKYFLDPTGLRFD